MKTELNPIPFFDSRLYKLFISIRNIFSNIITMIIILKALVADFQNKYLVKNLKNPITRC